MAYKFQIGQAAMSGALEQAGEITFLNGKGPEGDQSASRFKTFVALEDGNVDIPKHNGTIGLMLGGVTVTSTAAELNLLDTAAVGSVVNSKAVIYSAAGVVQGTDFKGPDGFDIGNATTADALKFNATELIVKDGVDFTVAKVAGLRLADGAVSSTAAELNLLDGSSAGSVVNSKAVVYSNAGVVNATDYLLPDAGGISNGSVTDFMLFNADTIQVKDGAFDFDIASHDTSTGLKLGGTLVTATAAELNLIDGSGVGNVVNSKAVIYSAGGQVNGTSLSASTGITGSSLQMGAYGLTNAGQLAISSFNADWTNAGRTVANLGTVTTATIGVSIVPDAAGGADIGADTVGFGDIYIADDKKIKFGNTSGGDATIEYDEDGTDELRFAGAAVTFESAVSFDGDLDLGNATGDTITCTGRFDSDLVPSSDSARDLGTSGLQWAEAHIDTGYIDTVTATNVDGILGANTAAAATVTTLVASGDVDLCDNTSDTITATGRFDSSLVPSSDSARDLGTSALRWSTLYVDSIVGADLALDTGEYGAAPYATTISASTDFALIKSGGLSIGEAIYTLPTCVEGKVLHIKLSGSQANVTIKAGADDSIEDSAAAGSIYLESTGSAVTLVGMNPTHWFII